MKKDLIIKTVVVLLYASFLVYSYSTGYKPGIEIGEIFTHFISDLIKIIPCVFILIGLFEVWVKKETVEKHLGENSSFLSYLWVILLAGTSVGGLYLAFPVAYTLFKKGARLAVIFTYIGAAAVCRIPMTMFEASFLGIKFTVVRIIVSLPLIIISSILLEKNLIRKNFKIKEG
jgi:uncharacterized membrane protein YraQ (UPF0718 family)